MKRKHADTVTSYEYMLEHLYSKPHLYENSFRKVKGYLMRFRAFESLEHLLEFLAEQARQNKLQTGQMRLVLKLDLFKLDKAQRWLRPEITEMLLFILWDELRSDSPAKSGINSVPLRAGVEAYGMDDRFAEAYFDLMMEMEENRMQPQITQIK